MTEDELYLAIWGACFTAAGRLTAGGLADHLDRQAVIAETIRQVKEQAAAPLRQAEAVEGEDPDDDIDLDLLGVRLDPALRDDHLASDVASLIADFAVDDTALVRALVVTARAASDIAGGLDVEMARRAEEEQ